MNTVADSDADTKDKPPPPWYLRGKSLIIGAGAVAAAITAVLGLWDRVNPEDETKGEATIELVQITTPTDLRDFDSEQLGTDPPLEADRDTTAQQLPAGGHAAAVPVFPTAPPPQPQLPPAVTVPPVPPTVTVPPTPVPAPSATEPETSPSPSLPAPSPSSSGGWTEPPEWTEEWTEVFALEVVENPVLTARGYDLRPEDLRVLPTVGNQSMGLAAGTAQSVEPAIDANGASPAPAAIAMQIVEALSVVEGTDSAGNPAPRGWTVAVDFRLEGLEGVPLLLTWSLSGIGVTHSWDTDTLAYLLEADSDSVKGSEEIWVPDLTPPGTYQVNVQLIDASTGDPKASWLETVPD